MLGLGISFFIILIQFCIIYIYIYISNFVLRLDKFIAKRKHKLQNEIVISNAKYKKIKKNHLIIFLLVV